MYIYIVNSEHSYRINGDYTPCENIIEIYEKFLYVVHYAGVTKTKFTSYPRIRGFNNQNRSNNRATFFSYIRTRFIITTDQIVCVKFLKTIYTDRD